ncbi:FCD domain-containing protein [Bradyrhizobium sp. dw_411]|uniref:GntR family transcriptional regulator n=1 Tax=Bradyrhizobium sp. dw_411 TaxID=2720082 RepID=UPI001BCFE454|nr:FCD domain-containing protein [Bradyrhizobium sp. dw_411]
MKIETLSDSIYAQLRSDVVSGACLPGAPLRIEDLRERYGASSSPLREAMFRLSAEGFLVLSSQRGFRAAPVSREELADLTCRRTDLEVQAIRLSIDRLDEEWEGELVKRHHRFSLISRRLQAGDEGLGDEWEARHRELHLCLISGCGSPWLLRFCESLYDHFDRYRRLAHLPHQDLVSDDEDAMVVAALRRDADEAARILNDHISRTSAAIRRLLFEVSV